MKILKKTMKKLGMKTPKKPTDREKFEAVCLHVYGFVPEGIREDEQGDGAFDWRAIYEQMQKQEQRPDA